jgi:hypothetical protein
MPNKPKDQDVALEDAISVAANALHEASMQLKALVDRASAKAGTRPTPTVAPAKATPQPPPPPAPVTLEDKIRIALWMASLSVAKLAKALSEPVADVQAEIDRLAKAGHTVTTRLEEQPIWTWRIGDGVDGKTIKAKCKQLMSENPVYSRDLVRLTGASARRVENAVIDIRREERVMDMSGGAGRARLYFLPTAGWSMTNATEAGITPRGKTKNERALPTVERARILAKRPK